MTYRLDGWQDIDKADTFYLKGKLDRAYGFLAYDLKVCGSGYPSPQKEVIREIIVELARRGVSA